MKQVALRQFNIESQTAIHEHDPDLLSGAEGHGDIEASATTGKSLAPGKLALLEVGRRLIFDEYDKILKAHVAVLGRPRQLYSDRSVFPCPAYT